jgi:hypothetical protein
VKFFPERATTAEQLFLSINWFKRSMLAMISR